MKMKLCALIIVIWFTGVHTLVSAGFQPESQSEPQSKDLFYQSGSSHQGVKVSILLNRNGQETTVRPTHNFVSGDRIKFILEMNYSGYLAIINKGSSSRQKLIYPQGGGISQVQVKKRIELPSGSDWIRFDEQTGKEEVTILMSNKPFKVEGTPSAGAGTQPTSGSIGGVASPQEEAEILAALNKSITKDLEYDSGNSGFTVTASQNFTKPIKIVFTLNHGG